MVKRKFPVDRILGAEHDVGEALEAAGGEFAMAGPSMLRPPLTRLSNSAATTDGQWGNTRPNGTTTRASPSSAGMSSRRPSCAIRKRSGVTTRIINSRTRMLLNDLEMIYQRLGDEEGGCSCVGHYARCEMVLNALRGPASIRMANRDTCCQVYRTEPPPRLPPEGQVQEREEGAYKVSREAT